MATKRALVLYNGKIQQIRNDDYLYVGSIQILNGGKIKSSGRIIFQATSVSINNVKLKFPITSVTPVSTDSLRPNEITILNNATYKRLLARYHDGNIYYADLIDSGLT